MAVKNIWVHIIGSAFSLSALILSLSLTWLVLFSLNFLYPLWHDHTGIAEGIEHYGPLNRYKSGFGDTSHEQRYRLFAEINHAVHTGGKGLADIQYQSVNSSGPQALLRESEIVHLQDVARLIHFLYWLAGLNLVIWLMLLVAQKRKGIGGLSWRGHGLALLSLGTSLGLALLLFGPTEVFNQLHIWIFPDDHEWFFYYQDSLMSTMMLAPRLFGWIAAVLGLGSCLVFFGLTLLSRRFLRNKKAGEVPA